MYKGYKYIEEGMLHDEITQRIGVHQKVQNFLDRQLQIPRGVEPLNFYAKLNVDERKKLLKSIKNAFPNKNWSDYKGCVPEVTDYVETCQTGSLKQLRQDEFTDFTFDIKVNNDYLFIYDQYIRFETEEPELDISKIPDSIANFDIENVRFRYAAKPGIRLFHEYNLGCDTANVQTIQQDEVLLKDKHYIPTNLTDLWNEHIGHDLGVESNVVLPDTDAIMVQKLKLGYQTPKKQQNGLRLMVPLFFNHNETHENRLNTGMMTKNTLSVRGQLQKSNMMVTAEYYDGVEDPIKLECLPLKVKKFNLVTCYVHLDDVMHALSLTVSWNRLVSLVDVKYYHIKDLEEPIVLRGQATSEAMTISVRPFNYANDFDKWLEFGEVEEVCTQVPIVINDINGDPGQLAISPTKYLRPVQILEKIGFEYGEEFIKSPQPPEIYDLVVKSKLTKNTRKLNAKADDGLYMLLFNELYLTNQISCLYNQASLFEPILRLELRKDMMNAEQILNEKYTVTVFTHMLNFISSYGRSFGLNYMF